MNVLFLTPEQDQARRFFRKGLLVGVAGTGKTIILRAIADELLQDKDARIVFVAPSPHDTRMRKHFVGNITTIYFLAVYLYSSKIAVLITQFMN